MSEIQEKLTAVELPQYVWVPEKFKDNVTYREKLENTGAPYGEAQRIKRLLWKSHAAANKVDPKTGLSPADVKMGLVNPYYMCEQRVWDIHFAPDETLKLMALLGDIMHTLDADSVVRVNVADALTPRVHINDDSYMERYKRQKKADGKFWFDVRVADYEHRHEILLIGQAFMAEKYRRATSGSTCNLPKNESTFPCKWGMIAEDYFAANWQHPTPPPAEHKPAILGC